MIIRPATETWFAFPVTNETEVHHDKGSGARWHIALRADNGSPVVSDAWRVFYGVDYGNPPNQARIGWDHVPPLYVQSAVLRMIEEASPCGTNR